MGRRESSDMQYWRNQFAPIVAELKSNCSFEQIRYQLMLACPCVERTGLKYRAWLKEIHHQIGKLRPRTNKNQLSLF